jgi:hypothetical protein
MKGLALLFLLLLSALSVAGQPAQRCLAIVASPSNVDAGALLVFTATVANIPESQILNYKWKISAGTITSGEGTSTITVDTAGLGGQNITATVEAVGAQGSCSSSPDTVRINPLIICRMKFDEYGDISFEDEKARLDNFAIQIANTPSSKGALIAYAGNPTYQGEAADRLRRAKHYLVKVRGMPSERIVTVYAGYKNDLTVELRILMPDEMLPEPSPTVKPEDVKFTKRRPSTNKRARSQ